MSKTNTLFELIKSQRASIRPFIAPKPSTSHSHQHLKSHGDIIIRDQITVKDKIRQLQSMGLQNFQIMTDFDQTLTKLNYTDGKKADSSFKAIQDSTYIPEQIKLLTRRLFDKYHPMEIDLQMSREEKEGHMVDWWMGSMELFSTVRLQKQDYGMIVLESRLLFRHGICELLNFSEQKQLPFYIVSGGISEIIEACFYAIMHNGEIESEEVMSEYWHKHISVLSNKFIYQDNIGVDYVKPIIHILNKQKFIYDLGSEIEKRSFRKNVLIMGDILDDVKMVRESQHEVVLKIGFLNDISKNAHLTEEFSKTFDIVITGDGSLEPVNYLLKTVFEGHNQNVLISDQELNQAFKAIKAVLA